MTPDLAPPTAEASPRSDHRTMVLLTWLAVVGGAILAGIGFTGSYTTLRELAARADFAVWFTYLFPIGIDASIVVLLATDLVLTYRRIPKPMLRWMAHLLTGATIVFNAAAAPGPILAQPLDAAMHGVLPLLFVIATEGARHYIRRTALEEAGEDTSRPPLVRWLLAPHSTAVLARRMRLRGMTWTAVLAQDQQLRVHRERLRQQYRDADGGWKKAATPDEMLPFKLAPFGVTVDEALTIPLLENVQAAQREGRAALQRAQAAVQKVQADVQIRDAEIQAEVDQIQAQGRLELIRQEAAAAAEAEIQRRQAEVQRQQSEVQAETRRIQEDADAYARGLSEEAGRRQAEAARQEEKERLEADLERSKLLAQKEQIERQAADAAAQAAVMARQDEERRQAEEQDEEQRRQRRLAAQQREDDAESAARAEARQAQHRAEQARLERQARQDEEAAAKAAEAAAESRAAAAEREETAAESAARAAAAREQEAAAVQRAQQEVTRTAELAARAAELEAAAVEHAARARMSQPEWDAHRVAAWIAAGQRLVVDEVATRLGVSTGTAHDRLKRAQELLNSTTARPALAA